MKPNLLRPHHSAAVVNLHQSKPLSLRVTAGVKEHTDLLVPVTNYHPQKFVFFLIHLRSIEAVWTRMMKTRPGQIMLYRKRKTNEINKRVCICRRPQVRWAQVFCFDFSFPFLFVRCTVNVQVLSCSISFQMRDSLSFSSILLCGEWLLISAAMPGLHWLTLATSCRVTFTPQKASNHSCSKTVRCSSSLGSNNLFVCFFFFTILHVQHMNVFRLVPRLDPCGHELASRNTLAYSLFIYFNAKRKKKKKKC